MARRGMMIMEMMQVPVTTSQLRNVLVRILTHPRAAGELVATAAELLAADERYDDWFVRVAKPSASQQDIEEALRLSDSMTDAVESAWCHYEKSSGADCSDLLVVLKSSVAWLRAAIGTASGRPVAGASLDRGPGSGVSCWNYEAACLYIDSVSDPRHRSFLQLTLTAAVMRQDERPPPMWSFDLLYALRVATSMLEREAAISLILSGQQEKLQWW
jgi:hypothetical protein